MKDNNKNKPNSIRLPFRQLTINAQPRLSDNQLSSLVDRSLQSIDWQLISRFQLLQKKETLVQQLFNNQKNKFEAHFSNLLADSAHIDGALLFNLVQNINQLIDPIVRGMTEQLSEILLKDLSKRVQSVRQIFQSVQRVLLHVIRTLLDRLQGSHIDEDPIKKILNKQYCRMCDKRIQLSKIEEIKSKIDERQSRKYYYQMEKESLLQESQKSTVEEEADPNTAGGFIIQLEEALKRRTEALNRQPSNIMPILTESVNLLDERTSSEQMEAYEKMKPEQISALRYSPKEMVDSIVKGINSQFIGGITKNLLPNIMHIAEIYYDWRRKKEKEAMVSVETQAIEPKQMNLRAMEVKMDMLRKELMIAKQKADEYREQCNELKDTEQKMREHNDKLIKDMEQKIKSLSAQLEFKMKTLTEAEEANKILTEKRDALVRVKRQLEKQVAKLQQALSQERMKLSTMITKNQHPRSEQGLENLFTQLSTSRRGSLRDDGQVGPKEDRVKQHSLKKSKSLRTSLLPRASILRKLRSEDVEHYSKATDESEDQMAQSNQNKKIARTSRRESLNRASRRQSERMVDFGDKSQKSGLSIDMATKRGGHKYRVSNDIKETNEEDGSVSSSSSEGSVKSKILSSKNVLKNQSQQSRVPTEKNEPNPVDQIELKEVRKIIEKTYANFKQLNNSTVTYKEFLQIANIIDLNVVDINQNSNIENYSLLSENKNSSFVLSSGKTLLKNVGNKNSIKNLKRSALQSLNWNNNTFRKSILNNTNSIAPEHRSTAVSPMRSEVVTNAVRSPVSGMETPRQSSMPRVMTVVEVTVQELNIFGGMADAYDFETNKKQVSCDLQKYLLSNNPQLKKDFASTYMFMESLRVSDANSYKLIKSFLKFPYQAAVNKFYSLDFTENMTYDGFEKLLCRILVFHCEKENSCKKAMCIVGAKSGLCSHLLSIFRKFGYSGRQEENQDEGGKQDKRKKSVLTDKTKLRLALPHISESAKQIESHL